MELVPIVAWALCEDNDGAREVMAMVPFEHGLSPAVGAQLIIAPGERVTDAESRTFLVGGLDDEVDTEEQHDEVPLPRVAAGGRR